MTGPVRETLTPDICVIGAGSAGLTVAAAASSFGHDVVLIERGKMGGDCLNYGCVPSKSLIAAAKHAYMARDGARFGIHADPKIDYGAVHAHIHGVIAAIAPHDSVERFEGLGVRVIKAHARFVDGETVEADGVRIRARRFVVATGSRPIVPPIPGLGDVDPLTNESVFDLTALPPRLAVIGAGPIGAELGQAFSRLGSSVTVATGETLLAREDPEAVTVVRRQIEADGVTLMENAAVERCERNAEGVLLTLADGRTVVADSVLVAVGRAPNVEDMGLEAAGIAYAKSGITVDKGLRTTNRRVFA
ncbi:MAG: FAD-dependent oxidoreductase, partial [Pseudomonadota bacterium]